MGARVVTDDSLRSMLRCPVSFSQLLPASDELIADANRYRADGRLLNRIGQPVADPIDAGLVNADQSLLIPICGGIVIMLVDQLIPVDPLNQ